MKKNLHSIFKIGLLGILLAGFVNKSMAQTVEISANPGFSGNIIIGASDYHVLECIYLDAEIGTSNFIGAASSISKIYFHANEGNGTTAISAVPPVSVTDSFKIYFKNVPAATKTFTAGAFSLAGYTNVYTGTLTIDSFGWNPVTLITPFARTAGTNLQMLIVRADGVSQPGYLFSAAVGNSTSSAALSSRRYNNTTAPVSGTTALATSTFRPAIQFVHPLSVDVSAENVTGGPAAVSCNNNPASYDVTIKNYGTTAAAIGAVTVNVALSGANTSTTNKTNTSLLAPGASETLSFTNLNISNNGTTKVTITAKIASDGDITNDSIIFNISAPTPIVSFPANESAETNPLAVFPWIKTVAGARQLWRLGAGINNVDLSDSIPPQDGNLNYIFDNYSGANSAGTIGRLYSSCITLPSGLTPASYHMNFWLSHDTSFSTALDSMIVVVSTDKGATWTRLGGYQRYNATYTTAGWGEDSVSLAAYAGQTIQLGFEGQSDYGNVMCLDNITVWANGPLPIKLNMFAGVREGNKNILSWETAQEQNNKGFELQRSVDGKEFTPITFVNSKATNGNSSVNLSYTYMDSKPSNANNYYRLRQVDFNGKESFSNVVLLKSVQNTKAEITTVYPNPAKEKINVVLNTVASEKITVKITDLAGRIISVRNVETIVGDNNLQFNTSALANGTYLIKVTTANNVEIATQKFVKM